MTRTLVLTVDRDNDLGIKTAIRGPVVGRRQVLTAALKLGIADPEESDTNAILGALSQHDALLENGADEDEVEVAILTGDEKVGVRSDRAIAAQLEEVVTEFQPDQAILVTDGAEVNLYCRLSKVKLESTMCRKLLSSNQRVSKEHTTTSPRRLKTLSGERKCWCL